MIYNFVTSKKFNNFILLVIIINAITLGMETNIYLQNNIGSILILVDRIALIIFSIEIIMKIFAFKVCFIRDPWNIFDFIIVIISYIPATGGLTILRALRVLRVLRLVSTLPKLRIIVQSLLFSLPSIAWISLLMIVVFYIFAVMATRLFGASFPEWFGSLGESFFTLFQIMTLESWAMGIARPVIEVFPYAYLFFIPFVLMSSFVVLNVFIAIIVNGMNDAKDNNINKNIKYNDHDINQNLNFDNNIYVDNLELKKELNELCIKIKKIESMIKYIPSDNVNNHHFRTKKSKNFTSSSKLPSKKGGVS